MDDPITLRQHGEQSLRAALVTPSASPPILRSLFSPPRSGKPAAKRQRLESTPSSLSLSTSSSRLSVDKQQLCDEARRASSMRLLNTWSQLAQRYARPLDEDDIIDLRDGEFIKDRGVLRAVPKNYRIGHLLDSEDPLSDVNDASSDGGALTEGEDDIDELDSFAFADDPDLSGDIKRERQRQERVPPVRQRDPMDAQDLQEFLEAEKLRKEIYGEEDEDEEVEGGEYDNEKIAMRRELGGRADTLKEWLDDFGDVEDGAEECEQADDGDADDLKFSHKSRQEATDSSDSGVRRVQAERALTPNTDDSEDELATWVIDESVLPKSKTPSRTVVDRSSPARANTPRTPSRTTIADEIIDLTESPPRSPLATRWRDSSQPSIRSPVRARSKSITRAKSMTRSTLKKANAPSVMQLYTPPLSSSSVVTSTPDVSSMAISRPSYPEHLPPVLPRPRLKPVPRYQGVTQSATENVSSNLYRPLSPLPNLDLSKMLCISNKPREPISKPKPIPRITHMPKYKAEVVITPMSKSRTFVRPTPSSPADIHAHVWPDEHVNDLLDPTATTTPQPRKDKGKSKDLSSAVGSSTPALATRSSSRKSAVPISKKMQTPDAEDNESLNVAPTRPQKRKRIVSSSSASDHFTPTAGPSTLPLPIRDKKGLREIEWRSSSSPTKSSDSSNNEYKSIRKPKLNSQLRFDIPPESKHVMYPYSLPHTPRHDHGRTQYPPLPMAPVQDPRAHFIIAQAMHQLSYLMTTGAPPGHEYPPPYLYPPQAAHWPPHTPKHDHGLFESSSPSGGPGSSSPSSVYAPFMNPYPYSFDTRYSDASLPPSSPPASSPPTSPVIRASSMARGRSKSRGRRVSFRLDENDKQLSLVDHQRVTDDEEEIVVKKPGSSKLRGGTEAIPDAPSRGRSVRRNVSPSITKSRRSGIAASSEDYGVQTRSSRERARTPGPPSRTKHTF